MWQTNLRTYNWGINIPTEKKSRTLLLNRLYWEYHNQIIELSYTELQTNFVGMLLQESCINFIQPNLNVDTDSFYVYCFSHILYLFYGNYLQENFGFISLMWFWREFQTFSLRCLRNIRTRLVQRSGRGHYCCCRAVTTCKSWLVRNTSRCSFYVYLWTALFITLESCGSVRHDVRACVCPRAREQRQIT
jgi:hypothetical protein